MNIRVPRTGKAAKIALQFLKSQGLEVSHSQALELIARLHGYADWQALEADVRFDGAPALKPISSNEFELAPKERTAWIGVDNISVCVTRNDEGVTVDLYAKGKEDNSLAGTSLFFHEVLPTCKACDSELDESGYCTDETCVHLDWPQIVDKVVLCEMSTEQVELKYGVTKRAHTEESDLFELSKGIKKEYLESSCSRHDVSHALGRLRTECLPLFSNEIAMWEFLMEEEHEDREARHNLVLVYGDHLENFSSEEDAQQFITKNSPDLPDRAYWEDEDCKELCEVEVLMSPEGYISLRS